MTGLESAGVSPPPAPRNCGELDDLLSEPHPLLVEMFRRRGGDLVLLGAGGKMGPSLARMARRAADLADGTSSARRIWAVSRFSDAAVARDLEAHGVATRSSDLMDPAAWSTLPDAPLVVFMVGCKFGTAERPGRTWVSNTLLPALCCQRYATSRIAAFSSGNIYPLVAPQSGGCDEQTAADPIGEYAMSVLGRERVFQHYALEAGIPVCLLRLNYAVELRYGVLVDIAQQVLADREVDRRTEWVNFIWQRDANALGLLGLDMAAAPAVPLNITGPTIESVTALATAFGERFGRTVRFSGEPQETALLNDARQAFARFYRPDFSLETLISWTAQWLQADQPVLNRPTHFQVRSGKF